MESKRQQKFSRLIQKDLSGIFQKEGNTLFPGCMLTVTIVRMSPDLGLAKVFVSVFPDGKGDEVVERLNDNVVAIRKELGRLIRNQVRKIPELLFFLDDTASEVGKIEKLFNSIEIPPAPSEEEK